MHVFLQLSWIGHLGIKWAFLHHEICDLQEVVLSKTNSILTGKQCSRCSCFYHRWLSFGRFHLFLQRTWKGLFGGNSLSPPVTPKLQEVFLEKLTQFPQGNNVLDSHDSYNDGLCGEIHVYLQVGSIGLFGDNRPYPPSNTYVTGSNPFKTLINPHKEPMW
jgi:hypothetical protein